MNSTTFSNPDSRGAFTFPHSRENAPRIGCSSEGLLNKAPQEVTFDQYMELIEMLPPKHYVNKKDFERFNLAQRTIGTITQQVVRIGHRYFTLYIDITDHTTWVTPANAAERLADAEPLRSF